MSLVKSYKKPLFILVLVFFMYKVFDYYSNVYEGFDVNLVASLRKQAAEAIQQANVFRQKIQLLRNEIQTRQLNSSSSQYIMYMQQIDRMNNSANQLDAKARELDKRAVAAETA